MDFGKFPKPLYSLKRKLYPWYNRLRISTIFDKGGGSAAARSWYAIVKLNPFRDVSNGKAQHTKVRSMRTQSDDECRCDGSRCNNFPAIVDQLTWSVSIEVESLASVRVVLGPISNSPDEFTEWPIDNSELRSKWPSDAVLVLRSIAPNN